jgi:hypothetical protein
MFRNFLANHPAMSAVIPPSHVNLYSWTFAQTRDSIHIILDLPDDVDVDSLSIAITKSPPFIVSCSLPNEVPFLAGTLYDRVLGVQRQFTEGDLILVFWKVSATEWPNFIIGPILDPFVIDPCSAFRLATVGEVNQRLLNVAIRVNFPPALIFQAQGLLRAGDFAQAEGILVKAADDYGETKAMCLLGMAYVRAGRFVDAERRFKEGADRGDCECANCLGELYSPVEGEVTGLEDARKAVAIFQGILERDAQYPFALYNLAKMYLNACGVPMNVAKAKEMYVIAKSQEWIPELSYDGKDLAEYEEPVTFSSWMYLAVPLLIGGTFATIRFLRRTPRPHVQGYGSDRNG